MSVVTAEVSELSNADPQTDIILENGKEDSQEKDEEKDSKDFPTITNGSELEPAKVSKAEVDDISETSNKQIQECNSVQDPTTTSDGETNSALKSSKDDDGEIKKQRPGTPQSRSSTPQRKSERVRSKQGSPSKSNAIPNLTPTLKILKINITPCKSSTNGTVSLEKSTKNAIEESIKSREIKNKDAETQEKIDVFIQNEKDDDDSRANNIESDNDIMILDKEIPKLQIPEGNAPYLRSLRLISGRRSLSSRSPYNSPSFSSTSESNIVSTTQWKKRQSRKKDGTILKDDSESEFQDTENEFNTSTNTGKRKAERFDDQSNMLAVSSLKKPKSEDNDLQLFLSDGNEEKFSYFGKGLGESEYIDDHLKGNISQQSSSADYSDDMAELKLQPESGSKDQFFNKDESMEFAYEAREVEGFVKSQDSPATSNQSSNKRWCILM